MSLAKIVNILFNGRDNVSPTVDDINNKINDIASNTGKISFGSFLASAQIVVGVISDISNKVYELSKSGAQVGLLSSEFDKIAVSGGFNAVGALDKLREASRNTISDMSLLTSVNKAFTLGVTSDVDQLGSLLQIADARANRLGLSTQEAFDNIVTGIGRESRLILDNLGIIIDIDKATADYAQTVGKTADELSDLERKQAIIAQITADSTDLIKNLGGAANENLGAFEQLETSITNLSTKFGELLAAANAGTLSEFVGVFQSLEETIDNTKTDKIEALKNTLIGYEQQLGEISESGNKNLFGSDNTADTLEFIQQRIVETKQELRNYGVEIDTVTTKSKGNKSALDENVRALQQQKTELAGTAQQAVAASDAMQTASSGVLSLAYDSAFAATEIAGLDAQLRSANLAANAFSSNLNKLTSSIIAQSVKAQKSIGYDKALELGQEALLKLDGSADALNANLQAGNLSALEMALTFGQIEGQVTAPFSAIDEAAKTAQQSTRATGSTINSVANEAEQAFSSLKSQVSGVLNQALSSDVFSSIDFEGILPREDAINEDARRLADVAVRGYESPWAEYLKNKFPNLFTDSTEDIKVVAAQIIKNFQAGLVPELIDKETAKETVRKMLVGETKLEELASEIASELSAEFAGIGLADLQAKAAQALGVSNEEGKVATNVAVSPVFNFDSEAATASSQAFANEFSNQAGATIEASIAATIVAATNSDNVLESSALAGKSNGEVWGRGFLDIVTENIPAKLIDILSLLILPNIEAFLAQSATREASR